MKAVYHLLRRIIKFIAITIFWLANAVLLQAQTTLYSETFTAANGTTSGTGNPAKWTIDVAGTSPTVGSVQTNIFQYQDLDGEAEWYSQVMYISGWANVNASVYLPATANMESGDYINVYYKLNGGAETAFTTNGTNTQTISARTASVSGLSGSTLQIVVRMNNTETNENHYIDNVTVTGDNNLYSEPLTYSDGTTSSSKFTTTCTGCDLSDGRFQVRTNKFEATAINAVGVWTSSSINISACTGINLSVALTETGTLESTDYVRVYYKLNGGAETLFATNGNKTDDFTSATATQTGLSGSTMQIVIRVFNNSSSEYHYWDNITVIPTSCPISALSLSSTGTNSRACSGTGTVNLTVSGGQAPFSFSWSNSATTEDVATLTAGTYSVTVTGNNGATATTSRAITQPSALSASAAVSSSYNGAHVSCPGSANGSINLTVSGGRTPYTYSWSSGNTTEDLSGKGAGAYTVTATDADGCTVSATTTINNPTALGASTSVTNTTCPISSDGAINLTVTGGTGSKTYQWSSGQTSEDISSVIVDPYTVTVTDANGCTATTSASVASTSNISSTMAITHVSTTGGSDGAVTQTVTGGSAPYTYNWSNGSVTKDILLLTADVYVVTITDFNGCQYNNSANVKERISVFCEDFSSYSNGTTTSANWTQTCGSCTVGADGDWEVSSNKWQAADVDAQGVWTSSVMDISGYKNLTAAVDVTESGDMGADDYIRIYYKLDGGAETYFGTNGNLTDDITLGAATASHSGFIGSTFQIVIRIDNDAGTHIHTFDNVCVKGEVALSLAFSQANVSCNGGSNASIDLSVHNSGTIPPIYYKWSNGAATQDLSGLAAGAYTVTVRDNSGTATYSQEVAAGTSDADQTSGGTMDLTDTKLAFTSTNTVGIRFTTVTVPVGAAISNAYIEFVAQAANSGSCNFTITGQNTDNAGVFTSAANDITGRTQTTASVTWSAVPDWTTGTVYQSGNISSVISEITSRAGWTSGNSIVLRISSTNTRNAASNENSTYAGPKLFITYAPGITKTGSVTITQPTVLTASISPTNTICPTAATGSANLTPGGGTAPRTFLWSNGVTSEDLTGLTTGSYTVTVTDAKGCTATAATTINSASNLSSVLTITNLSVAGGSDGAISQVVTGGVGLNTYIWSNGATTKDISGLVQGIYTVTITDANGCTLTKTGQIIEPAIISCQDFSSYPNGTTTSSAWTQTCTSCSLVGGGSTGNFDVQSGQWMSYDLDNTGVWMSNVVSIVGFGSVRLTVDLSETDVLESNDYIRVYYKLNGGAEVLFATNGDKTDDFTSAQAIQAGLSGSTVQIVIRVWNDLEHHYFDNVCIRGYAPFYLNLDKTNVNCNGGTTGQVDMSITNNSATLPFTYNWSNGSTTEDITALSAGTYTVTVADSAGVTITASATLTQPAESISVNNTIVPVTCHGGNDAAVILAVSGGVPPYSFLWSNGSTSMNATGFSAGTYTVTITDGVGCASVNTFVVPSPTLPLDVTYTGTPGFCTGGSTQITLSGASNYSWTPSTGLSATNIPNPVINPASTQTYYVTGTSLGASNLVANGDFESGNIGFSNQYNYTTNDLIPEGRYAIGTNSNTYHPNFFGAADHTSGSGKFMIINAATTLNMQVWCQSLNIQAGASYAFSTWISSVHPSNPAQLEFSINGTLLGTAITAPSVRYVWNQFTANWISNTSNANFCIVNRNTVAGGNDFALDDIVITPTCVDVDTVTVVVNSFPSADADADGGPNQNICYGSSTTLTASGGTGYSWSNGATTAANNVSPISNTTYTVTVTSAAGCASTDNVAVTVYPQINISVAAIEDVVCGSNTNGFIDISVSGGGGSFTYAWSNGAITQDISSLVAGTYTVTVTDANSCTVSLSRTLSNTNMIPTLTKTDISCNNANDGSISVSVSGGLAPYTYSWSTGGTAQNIGGMSAGSYTVTATDQNGCTASGVTTIVNPAVLTPSAAVTNITCNGLTNGIIDLSVAGGWTPYSYSWNGGQTTQDRSALAVESYTVTVTDNRSCTATLARSITQPATLTTSKSVTNLLCNGSATGAIDLTVNGGTSPYTYAWTTGATTQDLTNKLADEYHVTVTDANSCTKIDSAIITQPASAVSASLDFTDVTCTGIDNGTVTINASGGTGAFTRLAFVGYIPGPIDSSNALLIEYVTSSIDSLAPLALTFIVTDANGCTTTVSGEVGSEGPVLSLSGTHLTCSGNNNGTVDLTVIGAPPFTYAWTNSATTQDLSSLAPGYYEVTVTDSVNCLGVAGMDILAATVFGGTINETKPTCPYSTNGSADLVITGGGAPITYAWSTGATTQDLTGLGPGSYTVTGTENSGCTFSTSKNITAVSNTASSMTVTDVTIHAGSDGAITQTVTGGVGPYSYNWSNGAGTKNIVNIPAGTYTVTITDASGCTLSAAETVTEPGACPCTWLGVTDNDWRTITNWDCGFEPTDTCDVVIPSGTTFTCNVQSTVACRDLTINASVTLIISGSNQLNIYGDLSNSGTFTRNTSLVRFMGAAEQQIAGSTETSFYNVHISNSSATGVVMQNNFRVYNEIRLIDGYLFTGTDTVKVESTTPASLSVFSANSFVVGKIRRKINGTGHFAYEFPVGDAGTTTRYFRACIRTHHLAGTNYLTVWFDTLLNHADGHLVSAFLDSPEDMDTYYNYNVPIITINGGDTTTTTDYSGSGYTNAANYMRQNFTLVKVEQEDGIYYTGIAREGEWQFEPDVQPTGGFYDMKLYIANIAHLSDNNFGVLKRPTGANGWYWSGGGGKMNAFNGEGRKVSDGYALRRMLTTFSGGGAGGGGGGGLPIELLDFTAELMGDYVEINWVTATEINNDYFTIERSDGVNFRQIGIIPGAGNSSVTEYYSKLDYDPFIGTSYYRLKQTDYDGKFTYSDVVSIDYNPANPENEDNEMMVFPNPSNGYFSVVIKNASEKVTLNLFDSRGKLVITESYVATEDNYTHQVKVEGIPSGVYYLKAEIDEKTRYTKKLMLFNGR